METNRYHVLFAGDTLPDPLCFEQPVSPSDDIPVQLSQCRFYAPAIEALRLKSVDAVLVAEQFDGHSGLEFIHHLRLMDSKVPVVLLCKNYSDSLFYKAKKIGATDCVQIQSVNGPFLKNFLRPDELDGAKPGGKKPGGEKPGGLAFFKVLGLRA